MAYWAVVIVVVVVFVVIAVAGVAVLLYNAAVTMEDFDPHDGNG